MSLHFNFLSWNERRGIATKVISPVSDPTTNLLFFKRQLCLQNEKWKTGETNGFFFLCVRTNHTGWRQWCFGCCFWLQPWRRDTQKESWVLFSTKKQDRILYPLCATKWFTWFLLFLCVLLCFCVALFIFILVFPSQEIVTEHRIEYTQNAAVNQCEST